MYMCENCEWGEYILEALTNDSSTNAGRHVTKDATQLRSSFKSKSTQDLELGTQSGLTLSTENTLVDWRSTRLGRFKWCVDHNNGKHTLVHKGAHYSRTASAKFSNLEFIIPSYHHQLSNPIGRRLHIRVSFRINGEKEVKYLQTLSLLSTGKP